MVRGKGQPQGQNELENGRKCPRRGYKTSEKITRSVLESHLKDQVIVNAGENVLDDYYIFNQPAPIWDDSQKLGENLALVIIQRAGF